MAAPNSQSRRSPLFFLGHVYLTAGAIAALERSGQRPGEFLVRHVVGDWGTVCESDKRLNDAAVSEGTRIFSAYETTAGDKIWVITDADRSATTLLLPDEY
jgi:hypothetical protein